MCCRSEHQAPVFVALINPWNFLNFKTIFWRHRWPWVKPSILIILIWDNHIQNISKRFCQDKSQEDSSPVLLDLDFTSRITVVFPIVLCPVSPSSSLGSFFSKMILANSSCNWKLAQILCVLFPDRNPEIHWLDRNSLIRTSVFELEQGTYIFIILLNKTLKMALCGCLVSVVSDSLRPHGL